MPVFGGPTVHRLPDAFAIADYSRGIRQGPYPICVEARGKRSVKILAFTALKSSFLGKGPKISQGWLSLAKQQLCPGLRTCLLAEPLVAPDMESKVAIPLRNGWVGTKRGLSQRQSLQCFRFLDVLQGGTAGNFSFCFAGNSTHHFRAGFTLKTAQYLFESFVHLRGGARRVRFRWVLWSSGKRRLLVLPRVTVERINATLRLLRGLVGGVSDPVNRFAAGRGSD